MWLALWSILKGVLFHFQLFWDFPFFKIFISTLIPLCSKTCFAWFQFIFVKIDFVTQDIFYLGELLVFEYCVFFLSLGFEFSYSLKPLSGGLALTAHSFLSLEHPGCEEWRWGWGWGWRRRGRGGGEGRNHQRQRERLFEEWPWGQQGPYSQRST